MREEDVIAVPYRYAVNGGAKPHGIHTGESHVGETGFVPR